MGGSFHCNSKSFKPSHRQSAKQKGDSHSAHNPRRHRQQSHGCPPSETGYDRSRHRVGNHPSLTIPSRTRRPTPLDRRQTQHGWLRQENSFDISYRTIVRSLHQHHHARRTPRPIPEPPDTALRALKRKTCAPRIAPLLADPTARVLFGDEAGFERDPRPRHRWAKRGSGPTQGDHGGHLQQNIVEAVKPSSRPTANWSTSSSPAVFSHAGE